MSQHDSPDDSSPVSSLWRGRVLVAIAAIMWSTSGLFAKAPIFDAWPEASRGMLMAFWRAAFASLILAVMVRKVQWSWKLLPLVVAFALMNWTYLNGMVLCESSLAIWLQYTAPIWACLFAWRLFGERPRGRDWLLLTLAAAGLAIILSAELRGSSVNGVLYGLASGVFFAAVVVLIRWNKDLDAAWVVFLNHAVTAVLFFPILFYANIYPSTGQLLYLAGFGMFQLGLPYFLLAIALKSISSHEASGLTLLEPILVPVWVWAAWGHLANYEAPRWTTLIGGGLILVALVVHTCLGARKIYSRQCSSPKS